MTDRETTFAEVWAALPFRTRLWLLFDQNSARVAFDQAMSQWEISDAYEYAGESLTRSKSAAIADRWLARTKYYSGFAVPIWLLSIVIQILVKLWLDRGDDAMKNLRG